MGMAACGEPIEGVALVHYVQDRGCSFRAGYMALAFEH